MSSFNIRNPQAPNPGRMNMLPGQHQIPTGQQPMQQGMMTGMPNQHQQYPMMQQGMMPGQMFQPMYQRQMNPQNFQGMQGRGQQEAYNVQMQQGYMMQRVPFSGATPHEQVEMKKRMEKDKKERQFQEQQRRLKSMEKPGVRSGVNPLDDLIGRQLGSNSTNSRAPGGDIPGSMMQGGPYMQSQQLPQTSGMMLPQAGMYQTQGMMMQGPHMGIQQQSIMAAQMQGFHGISTQMTVAVNQGSSNQQQGAMMPQPSMASVQPLNVAASNSKKTTADNDDFGDFLQGPNAPSQPTNHVQMQTTFSTQVKTETSQPTLLQTNQQDFGSFHQAHPPSTLSAKPANELGDLPQGPTTTKQNPTEPDPALDVSFGEFEKAPVTQQTEVVSNEIKQAAVPPEVATTKEHKPKVLSLEDMMTQSTNLSAPQTTRKMFNQKKSLNDVKVSTSTSKTQPTFTDSSKARVWSGSVELEGMFAVPAKEKSGTELEETLARTIGESSVQQEVPSAVDSKEYPQWCLNESSLPLIYHQVLEATWNGNEIQTDKLYPILMCSNLDNQMLGHIWSLVNKAKPGQLIRQEMYLALALISLAQNGVSPLSIKMLNNFREAPTPQLVPTQHAVDSEQTKAASSNSLNQDEGFAPFQEAIKPVTQTASHPNLPLAQPMQFASFDIQNLTPTTSSPATILPPPTVTAFSSNDVLSEDLEMVSYIDQEMKSFNFHDPPSRNSSCHSSPATWRRDTTRDKLWRPAAGESSSISSDDDFTEFQSGSGSLSLDDRKNDFDDFSDPSAAKDASRAVPSKPHMAKGTGKNMKSVTKPNFNINFDAYKKNHDKKGAKTIPSSASAPKLTKLTEISTSKQEDDDDGFADFQTFSSSNVDTSNNVNAFHSSKKSDSVNDFGNFQSGGFADFNKVKHSASDTDLMALSGEVDKYSALRDILAAGPPEKSTPEETLQSDFDTMSLGSSTSLPAPSGSSGPPLLNLFGDFTEAPSIKDSKQDDEFTDFQNFPTNSLSNETDDGFADFQTATTVGKSNTFPDFQRNLDGAVFKANSTSNPQVDNLASSQSVSSKTDDDFQFANFQSAPIDNLAIKDSLNQNNMPSIFPNSEATENVKTNKDVKGQPTVNYDLFKSVKPTPPEKTEDPDDDDFGDFKFNEPPPLDDHNFAHTKEDDHFGDFESSVADYYGVEFDTIDDLSRTNAQTKNENYFGTYHADKGSKKGLGKLDSIANLDLKSFDLDLNLGGKVSEEEREEVADDSFGDFSSVPPVPDTHQTSDTKNTPREDGPTKASAVNQMVNTPAFGGDRYAMLAGDIQDDARHVLLWKRCLTSCLKVIQQANDTLNNISSSSVCNEVIKSVDGSEYLKGVIEIYRVACRVCTSIKAAGIGTEELNQMQKSIELVWNNLSAFLASASILPDDKSFIFNLALLHPEPSNISMACGVCLLNVDARSKAIDCSEDSRKLMYGGRQYHTTCANLWVNLVDSILPALPFNQLL